MKSPIVLHCLVAIISYVVCQDPPPPADGAAPPPADAAPPPPPADAAPPPPPPTDGGAPPPAAGAPPPTPEQIFPNLAAWKTDFLARCDAVKKTVADVPGVDDDEVKRVKKIARDIIRTIDNRMKEIEKVVSQRTVAAQLSDQEEKLSNAGRRLFGIKWNTIPCGAGFVQANCGKMAGC